MKKRLIYAEILAQQNSKKASIIIGPRQAGKTTILKELYNKLGGLFIDTDLFSHYEQIQTYEKLIATLKINGYHNDQKEYFYLFLDEFQRYPDLSMVIKSVYDHHDNIKIYATESSSLAIKNTIQESLAGRKIITHIYPLNFTEFLYFKDRTELIAKIENLSKIQTIDYFSLLTEAEELLHEFLVYGGYPEVVLTSSYEQKPEIIRSIFDLYIKKDFAEFTKIDKLRNARQLIDILAINNAQSSNYAKYGESSSISIETVKNYISILEETFIIKVLRPYYTNKNKEISKMPKIYFIDNGVRNYFSGGFAPIDKRADAGFLFESFYLSELIKRKIEPRTLKYYRTKNGSEIDIIIDNYPDIIPIEIKFKKRITKNNFSSIRRFINAHHLKKGYIISTGELTKNQQIDVIDCFRAIKF